MRIKSLLITSFCFLIVFQVLGQNKNIKNFIFLSNDYELKQNRVLIKWFSDVLKTKEGYNVYRKKEGETNWTKINKNPINQAETSSEATKKVQRLNAFFEAIQKSSDAEINTSGMTKALVKIDCIDNFYFAKDLGLAFVDENVSRGEKYQYEIRILRNKLEVLIETSAPFTVEPWKAIPAPDGFIVEKKRKGASIGWLHEDKKFFSVNVLRKIKGEAEFTKLNESAILVRKNEKGTYDKFLYFDEKVGPKDICYYKIQSIDFFGQVSEFTDEFMAGKKDFEAPAIPDSIFYDADSLQVKIWWKANTDADLLGYNIYRSLKYDKDFVKLNTKFIPKSITKYIDIVPEANDYFYLVSALDSSMNEREASPIMADVRDVIPPLVPKNYKVTSESGKIILTWDANTEKDLKGYNIFKAPLGAQEFIIINGKPIKENRFEEKIPKQVKTPFTYKIQAIDTNLNKSAFTPAYQVTMPDLYPPGQPFLKTVAITNEKPVLSWVPNMDNDLKSYAIFRSKYGKDTTRIMLAENIPKSDTSFTDKTAESNETYRYALYALDSAGNVSVSSTPYLFKFFDPNTKLKVKKFDAKFNKKDRGVNITWTLDTDKNYYGCILFRSYEGEDMQQYSPKLTDKTDFVDKSVKKPGTYTYQLRIYDKIGNIAKSDERSANVPKEKE